MSQLEILTEELAEDYQLGVSYETEPFRLRSGSESNWYLDLRVRLSHASTLKKTAFATIALAERMNLKFDTVAGMGIGGLAIMNVTRLEAHCFGIEGSTADAKDRYPRGLYGAGPADVREGILLVDDVFTSGSSLYELADMINERHGMGKINGAIVGCSRSDMFDHTEDLVAHGIPKIGALTHFYEGFPPALAAV